MVTKTPLSLNEYASISVAMCTFNGDKYLADQIQSILSQTLSPDEVVVADDGSTDLTLQLLADFANQAPFPVRVIQGGSGPLGVAKNFERAMSVCKGEIVFLSDQDDIWHVDRLLRTVEAFAGAPTAGYVFTNAEIINSEGFHQLDTLWDRVGFMGARLAQFGKGDQVISMLNGNNFTYGLTMAIRQCMMKFILPIDSAAPTCTHDVWSALILSSLGYRGIALEDCLVRYRQHAGQVVGAGARRPNHFASIMRSLRSSREYDNHLPNALDAAARRVRSFAPDFPEAITAARLLNDKAIHLRNCAEASRSHLPSRTLIVAKELIAGRYATFSASWRTALRDLLA